MRTNFTEAQLRDPAIREAEGILRKCVHCGFCTATCPTYVLLGDELDSPRGRIYLIQDMLEKDRPADAATVRHVDRCLSCLSCVTTCPSGVDYMHLVDQARAWIERTYRRPLRERLFRRALALVLPHPSRLRLALALGRIARPLARLLPGAPGAMLRLLPPRPPRPARASPAAARPAGEKPRMRVALLEGCAQRVMAPGINEATVRLLERHGAEVVTAPDAGCCGALVHHLGMEERARRAARAAVRAWRRLDREAPLDAIVANASGCGTMLKDYAHLLADDPLAGDAAWAAGIARDVSEVAEMLGVRAGGEAHRGLAVAHHAACSLQHGQGILDLPARLLREAGFDVRTVPDGHLCCGSAGTYNLLQPRIAGELLRRKAAAIESTGAAAVAAGNVGCIVQIAAGTRLPVLHTAELLDWASGGPRPPALDGARPAGEG